MARLYDRDMNSLSMLSGSFYQLAAKRGLDGAVFARIQQRESMDIDASFEPDPPMPAEYVSFDSPPPGIPPEPQPLWATPPPGAPPEPEAWAIPPEVPPISEVDPISDLPPVTEIDDLSAPAPPAFYLEEVAGTALSGAVFSAGGGNGPLVEF